MQLAASVLVCPRDGTQLKSALSIDPAFDKYEFLETIGEGGMGVIYKARQLMLSKFVAIKTLHAHLLTPEAMRRFQIEGKAASQLSHPNIVSFYDLGVTMAGQPYIVMEYIQGETLADLLKRAGQLPLPRFSKIFRQICDGIGHAHKKSILHRDIKPSNIMLTENDSGEDEVRIMDFGIAKLLNDTGTGAEHLTKTGDTIGSPVYMSPEQARGAQTDPRSDLYSLGCVMYEVLTGVPPFQGNTALDTMLLHLDSKPAPMKEASLGREIDPRIEKVVMKLLEKDPANRYQSMDEIKEALVPFSDPEFTYELPGQSESNKETDKNDKVTGKRHGKLVLAAMSACIIAGGAIVYLASKNPQLTLFHPVAKPAPPQANPADPLGTAKWPDMEVNPARIAGEVRRHNPELVLESIFLDNDSWHNLKDEDLKPLKDATCARISFEHFEVTDGALQYVKNSPYLKELDLGDTKVSKLLPLTGMKLVTLKLNSSQLDPAAFNAIASMKELAFLDLRNTNTTDSELLKLERMSSLKILTLTGCPGLTMPAVDSLQNKLYLTAVDYAPRQTGQESCHQLLARAREEHSLKHWSEASALVLQALYRQSEDHLSQQENILARVIRAECLRHRNYPLAALTYYNSALFMNKDRSTLPDADIRTAKAEIFESLPESKKWLWSAGDERYRSAVDIEKSLQSNDSSAQERASYLKKMVFALKQAAKDFMAIGDLTRAESSLRLLLTNIVQFHLSEPTVEIKSLLTDVLLKQHKPLDPLLQSGNKKTEEPVK